MADAEGVHRRVKGATTTSAGSQSRSAAARHPLLVRTSPLLPLRFVSTDSILAERRVNSRVLLRCVAGLWLGTAKMLLIWMGHERDAHYVINHGIHFYLFILLGLAASRWAAGGFGAKEINLHVFHLLTFSSWCTAGHRWTTKIKCYLKQQGSKCHKTKQL